MLYHYSLDVQFDFGNHPKNNRSIYSPLFTRLIKFRQSSGGLPFGIGAIIKTNIVLFFFFFFFFFFMSNGWRFKQATRQILGILVSFW